MATIGYFYAEEQASNSVWQIKKGVAAAANFHFELHILSQFLLKLK